MRAANAPSAACPPTHATIASAEITSAAADTPRRIISSPARSARTRAIAPMPVGVTEQLQAQHFERQAQEPLVQAAHVDEVLVVDLLDGADPEARVLDQIAG